MYFPFLSVSVTVFVPTKLVPVIILFLVPGPVSVKLWMLDLSPTMKVYFPCLTVATYLPWAFLSEIVKPGPMVPCSFGTANVVAPEAIPTDTSVAADARTTRRERTSRLLRIGAFPPAYVVVAVLVH